MLHAEAVSTGAQLKMDQVSGAIVSENADLNQKQVLFKSVVTQFFQVGLKAGKTPAASVLMQIFLRWLVAFSIIKRIPKELVLRGISEFSAALAKKTKVYY